MTANPLLQISELPNHAPAFDQIKDEHYLPAIEAGIEEAKANIEAIKNNPDAPTFENTIVALETASETLGMASSVFYNQLSAVGGDKLQEIVQKIGPKTAQFGASIMHDAALFARVKTVYDQDHEGLSPEQTMLLDETYKGFVRSGALLDKDKKKRLAEISERLSVLNPQFSNNVIKSSETFELVIDDKDDLAGLPDSAIDAAAHTAQEKGYEEKWVFTLDYPSYVPFIQYADNRELRETIWRGFSARAYGDEFDNTASITEIVKLRHDRAQLLGYKNHAQYVLEERMAERPETVFDFLEDNKKAYKPAAEKDLADLKAFAAKQGFNEELKPWDIAYYSEKLQEERLGFSSEDLRPYFPLDAVLDGAFKHFEKLFHLRFQDASDRYPVWHEDVKVFDVYNLTDGSFQGTFYADFHPRKGKKEGAWMTSYRDQGLYNGKIKAPVIAIVCNFTKPTKDKPSLLTHNEVVTLYHEMGHAMHGMLARGTYRSLTGINVKWDFVELPSQLQENWCFEKEALDQFARHYKTGEPIPEKLVEKLKESLTFFAGWMGVRQTTLATLDMAFHTTDPATIGDPVALEKKVTEALRLLPDQGGASCTSFSHIFAGGYSSGYYSYKWAEVLDADAFELFKERGLYDQATAEAYKNEILAKGGSEHPAILYRRFRGRDADPQALFRRQGIAANG